MDFSKFDARERSETGHPVDLVYPDTGEPIIDDSGAHCRVLVYGPASRKIQAETRKLRLAAMQAKDDVAKGIIVAEDFHSQLNETAALYIAGFENVSRGDTPCTTSKEDLQWFFDRGFPLFGQKADGSGMELKNRPFALQVVEAANALGETLGNGSKG